MKQDLSLVHAAHADRDFSYYEEQAQIQQQAMEVAQAKSAGILPVFFLHEIHQGGYLAERFDGSWCRKAKAIEEKPEIDRVRIVSPRVLYIRTREVMEYGPLADLIDFAYLPF